LLIAGGFQCEVKWFILVASIVGAILLFWFQKEEGKLTRKERVDIMLKPCHDKKYVPGEAGP